MKLLCLCVANSARSQMAEGLARAFHDVEVQVAPVYVTLDDDLLPAIVRTLSGLLQPHDVLAYGV